MNNDTATLLREERGRYGIAYTQITDSVRTYVVRREKNGYFYCGYRSDILGRGDVTNFGNDEYTKKLWTTLDELYHKIKCK